LHKRLTFDTFWYSFHLDEGAVLSSAVTPLTLKGFNSMAGTTTYTTDGNKSYTVEESDGTHYVTKPSWFPFSSDSVGTANSAEGAVELIKSDSGDKIANVEKS
jgi:hypothetical protein